MNYYLQNCSQGYVGNSPIWWADKGGYTVEIRKAKLFTEKEADDIIKSTTSSHNFKKWSETHVINSIIEVVDIDRLRDKQ